MMNTNLSPQPKLDFTPSNSKIKKIIKVLLNIVLSVGLIFSYLILIFILFNIFYSIPFFPRLDPENPEGIYNIYMLITIIIFILPFLIAAFLLKLIFFIFKLKKIKFIYLIISGIGLFLIIFSDYYYLPYYPQYFWMCLIALPLAVLAGMIFLIYRSAKFNFLKSIIVTTALNIAYILLLSIILSSTFFGIKYFLGRSTTSKLENNKAGEVQQNIINKIMKASYESQYRFYSWNSKYGRIYAIAPGGWPNDTRPGPCGVMTDVATSFYDAKGELIADCGGWGIDISSEKACLLLEDLEAAAADYYTFQGSTCEEAEKESEIYLVNLEKSILARLENNKAGEIDESITTKVQSQVHDSEYRLYSWNTKYGRIYAITYGDWPPDERFNFCDFNSNEIENFFYDVNGQFITTCNFSGLGPQVTYNKKVCLFFESLKAVDADYHYISECN